jgi:hypothetical protein
MKALRTLWFAVATVSLFAVDVANAQGPRPEYYYTPSLELPWARCSVYQSGGSQAKIPFLPIISDQHGRAPLGIGKYSRDIAVDAPVVFVGNGIVKQGRWDSYTDQRKGYTLGEMDVAGKVVMFCYDFPDSIERQLAPEFPISTRIAEAASRKAAGVMLFSFQDEHPFLTVTYDPESQIPKIPAITVSKGSVAMILLSAGEDPDAVLKEWKNSGKPPRSRELISRIRLNIKGNFEKVETASFLLRFRKEEVPRKAMEQAARVNEKAVKFLLRLLKEDTTLVWKKSLSVYFGGYDSKYFYTHHWGRGLADLEGTFMVHGGAAPDYAMAVHENTHILAQRCWSENTTSFMAEGFAKYAEAVATDKEKNHKAVVRFLKEGTLFPLEQMVTFIIGASGQRTLVGYPASGSFAGYFIETYGLKSLKEAYLLEGRPIEEKERESTWKQVCGKSLLEVEREWLSWIAGRYDVDEKYIKRHLESVVKERQTFRLDPETLEGYVGQYEISPGFCVSIVRDGDRLFADAPQMGKVEIFAESESKFVFKAFDGFVTFIKDEKKLVTQLVLHAMGRDMVGKKVR